MQYKFLTLLFFLSLLFSSCTSTPPLNFKKAFKTKDIHLSTNNYILKMHRTDNEILSLMNIKNQEEFRVFKLSVNKTTKELLDLAITFIDKDHDILNAYKILSILYKKEPKNPEILFHLGRCYFFMGEFYYEGYQKKYYEKAYNLFRYLLKQSPKNLAYLKFSSYAAAKTGAFIRDKKKGTFSGLSYLRESIKLNDRIREIAPSNADALLTEGEYQIESSSIPLFGGSKDKGEKLFKKVLAKHPYNLRAHLLLAKFYYRKKGKQKEAAALLENALKIYAQNKSAKNITNYYTHIFLEMHLARVYQNIKEEKKYREHLFKHLSLLPRSPSALGHLAAILAKEKNPKGACKAARRKLEIDPYSRDLTKAYCSVKAE